MYTVVGNKAMTSPRRWSAGQRHIDEVGKRQTGAFKNASKSSSLPARSVQRGGADSTTKNEEFYGQCNRMVRTDQFYYMIDRYRGGRISVLRI